MTYEEIKSELKEYYCNKTIIIEYEKANGKIEDLFEKATKVTSSISDMPNGTSEIQDKKAELVAKYVDLQNENLKLEDQYAVGMELLKRKNLIIHNTIMSLKNPFKAALIHIYENKKTRVETADIMRKSRQWVDITIKAAELEYMKARNEKA